MMKKLCLFYLVLVFLFQLSACGFVYPSDQSDSKTPTIHSETTLETIPDYSDPAWDDAALTEQNRFLHSLEQRAVRIGDVLYFSDCGVNNLSMIFAVDLNTMECFPLCGKPECEHNSSSCGACAGNAGSVSLTASQGSALPVTVLTAVKHGRIWNWMKTAASLLPPHRMNG